MSSSSDYFLFKLYTYRCIWSLNRVFISSRGKKEKKLQYVDFFSSFSHIRKRTDRLEHIIRGGSLTILYPFVRFWFSFYQFTPFHTFARKTFHWKPLTIIPLFKHSVYNNEMNEKWFYNQYLRDEYTCV